MNSYSEAILQATDVLMDAKVRQLKFDKTIQGEIYKIIDVDSGEYKVKYEGNTFSAFAADPKDTYKVKENVYVIVPEGDFSQKKIITASVNKQSLSYYQLTSLKNQIIDISPTFDIYYRYDPKASYGVIAGAPIQSPNSHASIYPNNEYPEVNYHGQFQQYANNYEYIRIKASFLTNFHSIHTQGNYGIRVTFYSKTNDESTETSEVSFQLDINSFVGDPYNYRVYSPQEVVFKVQKNYLLGIKSIELFEEGFEYDHYIVSGAIDPTRVNDSVPNIFAKDIYVSYVDKKDLTDFTYYCNIVTPKGNAITATTSSIDLVAQLIFQGEQILREDNCTCRWFKRDLSVMVGTEAYNKDAGFAWREVPQTEFGVLTLTGNELKHQGKYKLIIVYNEKVNVSAEIEVFNLLSGYNYEMEQVTEGDNLKLKIRNILSETKLAEYQAEYDDIINDHSLSGKQKEEAVAALTKRYYYTLVGDWYLSYPDNSYMKISDVASNEISIQQYLLYSSVIFYCGVYDLSQTEIIGTLEHTVRNSESMDDLTIRYIGEDTFRYDANGDVAIEDSEKERTLQVMLQWADGIGTSYKLEWIAPDGQPITSVRRNPLNSMIQELWIDSNNILHYNISQKYKINYNDNVIQVKVTTIDQQVYTFAKEIIFLKDGDQGTNGTTYVVAIRPCDEDGYKLSGFQPLVYQDGAWQNWLRLGCYVYKDGELLNTHPNYTIDYTWEYVNVRGQDTGLDYRKLVQGVPTVTNETTSKNLQFYVKVKVSIREKTNGNNRQNVIYASYPLDAAVGDIDASQVDLNDIPSYVKYTSSGVNPQFYSNNISFYYKNIPYKNTAQQAEDNDGPIRTLNDKILKITVDENNDNYLAPATSFIFEAVNNDYSNIGVLKCVYTEDDYIIHPVIMYLDTYGNEALNGWDGTSIDFEDDKGEQCHIFAPQIGAGLKGLDNKFDGVIMGKDSGQQKIGLYGYERGVNTFGLMDDGNAYFGVKGTSGRIEINSKKGQIYSGNYYDYSTLVPTKMNQGMLIDLAQGHIDSHNFLITSKNMQLDSATGSFKFRLGNSGDNSDVDTERDRSEFRIYFPSGTGYNQANTEKPVFLISKDNYYLQTRDFCNSSGHETGTKIDLKNGKITSYSFNLNTPSLKIQSSLDTDGNTKGQFDFNVSNGGRFQITDSSNKLVYIQGGSTTAGSTTGGTDGEQIGTANDGSFYIQSTNYSPGSKKGTRIDLVNGRITSYDFTLKTPNITMSSGGEDGEGSFVIDVKNRGRFQVKNGSNVLLNIATNKVGEYSGVNGEGTGTYYLKSNNYGSGQGMFINLETGYLYASSVRLSGNITATEGKIAGWYISGSQLRSGSVYLDGADGTISGAHVQAGDIQGTDITGGTIQGSRIFASQIIVSSSGLAGAAAAYIGYMDGGYWSDNKWVATGNIGIKTIGGSGIKLDSGSAGTSLSSSMGVYLECNGKHFQLASGGLSCDVLAENQHGIYARFA